MLMTVLALLAQPADSNGELRARVAAEPPVVRSYFERRANCNHWGGEEPYDAERRKQIEEAWRDLGCETIDAEEIFLRRYFAGRPQTLRIIKEADEQSGW